MHFYRKDNPEFINNLKWLGIITLIVGCLTLLFISPPNVEFTRQYYDFGLDRVFFLLVIFTLLLRIEGVWGKGLTLGITVLLFSLSLIYKWQTADNFSLISGFFPVRDANDYYQSAQALIYGMKLSGTSTFRPIYPAFLATIMWVTNGNLKFVLILLVLANAVAVFWATLEVNRIIKNSFFSAIFLILGYIYFRRFSGTLLTENLGFLMGNLALFFLLRGASTKNIKYAFWGLFLLTNGLNARAGAFIILPILGAWIAISFHNNQSLWKKLFTAMAVIIVSMAGNWLLGKLLNPPTSAVFANYSYTLYGLASGNKGWEQVLVDHPNVPENEIYALAFDKIRNNPILFMQGIAGAYSDYFVSSKGAFSFLLLKRDRNDILNTVLWALSLAGLISALIKRKHLQYSIGLAFFAGILLSVGLVPPVDSTMMRAYATTIPMSLYIVVLVGGFLSESSFYKEEIAQTNDDSAQLPILFSGFVLVISFIVPVLLNNLGTNSTFNLTGSCEAGKKKTAFVIAEGSSLMIDGKSNSSHVPTIEYARFIKKLLSPDQLADAATVNLMASMKPGTILTIVRLVATDTRVFSTNGFLVTEEIPQAGTQMLCVADPVEGFYFLSNGMYKTTPITKPDQLVLRAIDTIFKLGLWLIFLFVLIKSVRVQQFPARIIPFVYINTFFIVVGTLLMLHMTGLLPLAWQQQVLDSDKFRNPEGFMYVYNLGTEKLSDTKLRDYPSLLYENGILLLQPHESQSLISEYGRGSYILREKVLFFSTSDNSDPRTNQKIYTLESPLEIRIRYQVIVFSLAIIGILIHILYFVPILRKTTPKEAYPS